MSKDPSTPVKAKYNRFGDEEQPSEAETPSRKRPLANVDTDKAAPADKITIEVDVQRDGGLALIHGLPHGTSTDKVSRNGLFMDVQEIVKAKYGSEINPTAKEPKYFGKMVFFQGPTWSARDGTEVQNAAYEVAPCCMMPRAYQFIRTFSAWHSMKRSRRTPPSRTPSRSLSTTWASRVSSH